VRTAVFWGPELLLITAALLVRSVSSLLAVVVLAVSALWPYVLLWTIQNHPLRRGLHDVIAGTWVIDRAAEAAERS